MLCQMNPSQIVPVRSTWCQPHKTFCLLHWRSVKMSSSFCFWQVFSGWYNFCLRYQELNLVVSPWKVGLFHPTNVNIDYFCQTYKTGFLHWWVNTLECYLANSMAKLLAFLSNIKNSEKHDKSKQTLLLISPKRQWRRKKSFVTLTTALSCADCRRWPSSWLSKTDQVRPISTSRFLPELTLSKKSGACTIKHYGFII